MSLYFDLFKGTTFIQSCYPNSSKLTPRDGLELWFDDELGYFLVRKKPVQAHPTRTNHKPRTSPVVRATLAAAAAYWK